MDFLCSLLCASCLIGGSEKKVEYGSYLHEPAYCLDHAYRGKARAYVPQPGDIMLATDPNNFWKLTHDLDFAFEPHNSAIVVARPDGSLGILEAGPADIYKPYIKDTVYVRVLDLFPHLHEYETKGPVWIRKRINPLTPEESACLTAFAMRQEWKRFAIVRLGGQLTPFRARGPLRTYVLGKPRGDRSNYYCSELVTEACVAAGLVDAATARPSATYPHDLFFDRSYNLYLNRHFNLAHGWEPPARWASKPVSE